MTQTLEQFLGEDLIASIHKHIRSHPIHPETNRLAKDVLEAAKYACYTVFSDISDIDTVAFNRVEASKDKLLRKCRTSYSESIASGSHPTPEYQENIVNLMTTDFTVPHSVRAQMVKNRMYDLSSHFNRTYYYGKCDAEHLFLIPPEFRHLYTD